MINWKKDTRGPIRALISPLTNLMSSLRGQGNGELCIAGRLVGVLDTPGNLVITEKALVKADITAHNVSVAGAIQGNISANQVEVLDTGRVWGDVSANYFVVAEGGVIQGQIEQRRIGEASAPFQAPEELLSMLEALETRSYNKEAPTIATSLAELHTTGAPA